MTSKCKYAKVLVCLIIIALFSKSQSPLEMHSRLEVEGKPVVLEQGKQLQLMRMNHSWSVFDGGKYDNSPTFILREYETAVIGDWLFAANAWGDGNYKMNIWDSDPFRFSVTGTLDHKESVAGYPNVNRGWTWGDWAPNSPFPIKLKDLSVLKADWDQTIPDSGNHIAMFQLYTANRPDPGNVSEHITGDILIGINRSRFPLEEWHHYEGTFIIGGKEFLVMTDVIWEQAKRSIYVLKDNTESVRDFDIKALLDFSIENNWLNTDDYLVTLQAGFEIIEMDGTSESSYLNYVIEFDKPDLMN